MFLFNSILPRFSSRLSDTWREVPTYAPEQPASAGVCQPGRAGAVPEEVLPGDGRQRVERGWDGAERPAEHTGDEQAAQTGHVTQLVGHEVRHELVPPWRHAGTERVARGVRGENGQAGQHGQGCHDKHHQATQDIRSAGINEKYYWSSIPCCMKLIIMSEELVMAHFLADMACVWIQKRDLYIAIKNHSIE